MAGLVVVVGATSAIGRALVTGLADRGHALILAGRARPELERLAADTRLRHGVPVIVESYQACTVGSGGELAQRTLAHGQGHVAGVVLCHGYMPDEAQARVDVEERETTIRINYSASVELLESFAPHMSAGSDSFLCAVGSVAGDRGRPSNALYGSSKGALALYLSGLRARLSDQGVRVLTVKPGYVDSRMTWGLPGLFLVAQPEKVARDILRALDRNRAVVYTPGFWRFVMMIIRCIPDPIFRRLPL